MPVKPPCVGVAWSGGRDSTALLHSTAVAAAAEGLRVVALHVHHGWSPNADAWVAHCDRELKRWKRRGLHIALSVARLESRPQRGESVEAWARAARYNALQRMAMEEGASLVLMAHHRRDQAETLLLQALRGAGVAGLAGMPDAFVRGGIHWARPWLGVRREDIEGYVRRHRLVHIDDESNLDPRFARNRLRLQVWPALLQAFPDAEGSLADASRWAGQATDCLRELAEQDLSSVVSEGLERGRCSCLDLAEAQQRPASLATDSTRASARSQPGDPHARGLVGPGSPPLASVIRGWRRRTAPLPWARSSSSLSGQAPGQAQARRSALHHARWSVPTARLEWRAHRAAREAGRCAVGLAGPSVHCSPRRR